MDAADVNQMVEWGVDGFVHPPGITADDEGSLLRTASERRLPLSITLGMMGRRIEETTKNTDTRLGFASEYYLTKRNITSMIEMGAIPVFGSDMPGFPAKEIVSTVTRALSSVGLSNAEVLQASTRNVAQSLMAKPDLGTIEAGQLADIILVDGDPLKNLSDLEKVYVVIQDGKIVVDKRNITQQ